MRVLGEAIEHLRAETPLAQWPERAVACLRIALNPLSPTNEIEAAKAARLHQQLFLDNAAPFVLWRRRGEKPGYARIGDRLRADLAHLVPYGAGIHLLDYEQLAREWVGSGMRHGDFHVGLQFRHGDSRWRVTDVGSRTVIAVRADEAGVAVNDGPPYTVPDVFDEGKFGGCTPEPHIDPTGGGVIADRDAGDEPETAADASAPSNAGTENGP